MKKRKPLVQSLLFIIAVFGTLSLAVAKQLTPKQQAEKILQECNVNGGLVVHIGCGDGKIPVIPVWDGMIAANGRLYVSLKDGTVLCMGPSR